jgi:GDPmannose 4,6-dehydratase
VKRALITGASGQDGHYLAALLLARGTEVIGVSRASGCDITDGAALDALVEKVRPDECYHLAAHHRSSSAAPENDRDALAAEPRYLDVNLTATQGLLAALARHSPRCRVFLAGSCHMFGQAAETPQNERTPFLPNSLYGITKVAALHLGRMYRQRHGLFCATGILYNHESPRRGPEFVTTRLARGAVEVARGRAPSVVVGGLEAQVDWGFAGDYVEAMWRMLQAPRADDYVIATGTLHSVREFAALAFARVGLDWRAHVHEAPDAHRPVAAAIYCGDITKIRAELGWSPTTSFAELVHRMVDHYAAAL